MPRTGLNAEEIREKAIDATLAKMREVGFDKVRLTEIAKELKVSHAALYSHFKDKSDLLDAVSEVWLQRLDEKLETICASKKDPCEKIHAWTLALHRAKVEKIRHDPEPYKAFDMAADQLKPFIQHHLENMHRQMLGLVKEAVAKRRLRTADPQIMTRVIAESTSAFNHPRLVAQHIHEKREPLLREVLDSVLRGLRLKS